MAAYGWTSHDMHFDGQRQEWVIVRVVREEIESFPKEGGYGAVRDRLFELRQHEARAS